MPQVTRHPDAASFLDAVGPLFEERESENSLPLGLASNLAQDPAFYGPDPALFFSVHRDGKPLGGALATPPRRLILGRFVDDPTASTAALSDFLLQEGLSVPGTTGPQAEARAFASAWLALHPALQADPSMHMRLFEIRDVHPVPTPPGALRPATQDDVDTVAQWTAGFATDIGEAEAPNTAAAAIKAGRVFLWDDGGPVSMAKATRPVRNGISVAGVYTPPTHRTKGYATACVAALTRLLLASGHAYCTLYTDLANPTSNSIYAKIGYRPLGDALTFDFT